MSEFKFACPVCGQHMMCDASQAGTVMDCPTCFQKIVAPQAPADAEQKYILTGSKAGERPVPLVARHSSPSVAAKKSFPLGVVILVLALGAAVAGVLAFRGKSLTPAKTTSAPVSGHGDEIPVPVAATSAADAGNNLALNRPAFASSQQHQNPVQSGNDGNEQTRWCASSGSVPQWWEVDLGGTVVVTNTEIIWEQAAAHKYLIQVSSDNSHWLTLVDKTANTTPARINADNFSTSGKYVRVVATGLVPGVWASFYEFKVFGGLANATGAPAKQP